MAFAPQVVNSSDKMVGKFQEEPDIHCLSQLGSHMVIYHQNVIHQPNKHKEGQVIQSKKYSRVFVSIV